MDIDNQSTICKMHIKQEAKGVSSAPTPDEHTHLVQQIKRGEAKSLEHGRYQKSTHCTTTVFILKRGC